MRYTLELTHKDELGRTTDVRSHWIDAKHDGEATAIFTYRYGSPINELYPEPGHDSAPVVVRTYRTENGTLRVDVYANEGE
jgi:hypothetical protein